MHRTLKPNDWDYRFFLDIKSKHYDVAVKFLQQCQLFKEKRSRWPSRLWMIWKLVQMLQVAGLREVIPQRYLEGDDYAFPSGDDASPGGNGVAAPVAPPSGDDVAAPATPSSGDGMAAVDADDWELVTTMMTTITVTSVNDVVVSEEKNESSRSIKRRRRS